MLEWPVESRFRLHDFYAQGPGDMARFSFFERVNVTEHVKQLKLATYTPEIRTDGLTTGIDNLRHDVYLSPKFCEIARAFVSRLIVKYGNVEDLAVEDVLTRAAQPPTPSWNRAATPQPSRPADSGSEFKRMLADLQLSSLHQAKSAGVISVDVLARLAVLKFLRAELSLQFAEVLERCRARLKAYEGPRADTKGIELRDRFLKLQVSKKIVLRKAGQELFTTQRDIEKESLARTRRSLFGDAGSSSYDLFVNRLVFTDDGRDDYLNAEHYVMLGNYERDPDRFPQILAVVSEFFQRIGLAGEGADDERTLDGLLNEPENAQELLAGGVPDDSTPMGKGQRAVLIAWHEALQKSGMLDSVMASYEILPLLAEYAPLINPQQLKNALISRTERKRVEQLLEEHGRISAEKLQASVKRLESYGTPEQLKLAGRFLVDFLRYHRDLRRLEALNSAMDSVNVIGNEKLRELSFINNTLYEFLLTEEQKPAADKVASHVILKADIRDSTTLTRTLSERGLNPASFFSLNFYDPINKLLPKYNAEKVFIEGDAVILAMFEREGEQSAVVARTCMLAREMTAIVGGYNEVSQKSGLPTLEIGIGICYQDSAPMYLMDGKNRIMISGALNQSDRLSSCSRAARRWLTAGESLFNVFTFQTVEDVDTGGIPDEFLLRFNIRGIHINEGAFRKLQSEISLRTHVAETPVPWGRERVTLYSGLVPLGGGVFHRIVVREASVPHVNAADFTLKAWTSRKYYEVCTNPTVYEMVERREQASATVSQTT